MTSFFQLFVDVGWIEIYFEASVSASHIVDEHMELAWFFSGRRNIPAFASLKLPSRQATKYGLTNISIVYSTL